MMMNRKEFMDYLKDHVKSYLPYSYDNAKISFDEVVKSNDVKLTAMMIKRENEMVVPTIYIDKMYEDYKHGANIDSIVGDIADLRIEHEVPDMHSQLNDLYDYEKMKDHLQVRICDPDLNQERLSGNVYTQHGDFAAYYSVNIMQSQMGTGSIMVSNALLEKWDISVEQLHQDACASDLKKGIQLMNMEDIMNEFMTGEKAANLLNQENPEINMDFGMPFFCLSNTDRMNGASALCHEDIMAKIGEILGTDYFVLPSSVHELLIVPDLNDNRLPELTNMVKEVNETEVSDQEKLSDKVQHYDKEHKVLENAQNRQARLDKEKEPKKKMSIKDRLASNKEKVAMTAKAAPTKDKKQDLSL